MIVLDTNVISELARKRPDPAVLAWLDAQPAERLATTAVTAGELCYGVARLPAGRRRRELTTTLRAVLEEDLAGRVMPFDLAAAGEFGDLVRDRDTAGRPISVSDAQIAAICRSRNATLATRNTADFEGTGVDVVTPWGE